MSEGIGLFNYVDDADDDNIDDEIDACDADQSATSLSEGLRKLAVTYGITQRCLLC